ncbi:3-methyl-2-oxobutanoate hydroxymethyltransferase [Paraburkholderia sp. Tr-20389]|uniref:3-methyl-2-oxobutanoate hydroxymethyltransferase n=1 Tax=Paraburkholderia sp. Tr-20389 TaxID=2703903 RepID=UPI0019806EF2|nr:3-methyl-2-oxobutanoate hydroxymethyltransferase [Paraburkholderia sp. Tr-20389]MBN3754335.1 3-methyl-2-oxobutanoate hydroxymethyltransferase [Paraburkholderia sp. Tr-20389]
MAYLQGDARSLITVPHLAAMRRRGERITMLTCYDATFASLLDRAGVDIAFIGDSLGNVLQGHSNTLPVDINDIAYHTACVARGTRRCMIVADIPFGCLDSPEKTYGHAVQLIRSGAHMVKLEGGAFLSSTIRFLVERSIPVCAHIGLTPQSIHALGGFTVQGKTDVAAACLIKDAQAVEAAGAQLLVLEAVPSGVAATITDQIQIPTIGIGAGLGCSGQVLVLHDMLGISPGKTPRFVKNFMNGQQSIESAIQSFVRDVREGIFPGEEHCYR